MNSNNPRTTFDPKEFKSFKNNLFVKILYYNDVYYTKTLGKVRRIKIYGFDNNSRFPFPFINVLFECVSRRYDFKVRLMDKRWVLYPTIRDIIIYFKEPSTT